jgi:long-chain acyl-CoA synthetase
MQWSSLPHLFQIQAQKWKSRPVVYGKYGHHWRPLTWSQVARRAQAIGAGLIALGTQFQEKVGIWSKSGPNWVLCDLGALHAGIVNVPLYEGCSDDELVYILRDSGCVGLFVQGQDHFDRILKLAALMPDLRWVISLEEDIQATHVPLSSTDASKAVSTSFLLSQFSPKVSLNQNDLQVLSLIDLELLGEKQPEYKQMVQDRVDQLNLDHLLTLQYTSGTTGEPKGVMMTHGNLLANCEGAFKAVPIHSNDILLSFLPLSHSFERVAGYYMPLLFAGAQIYFSEGLGRLIRNLNEVSPTIMTGMPRIYEKIYARFRGRQGAQGKIQKWIAQWALKVSHHSNQALQSNRSPSFWIQSQLQFMQNKIFKELRDRLGGRLRFMVSGGAPLAIEVAEFFYATGLVILEGYGLSETGPVLSVNRINQPRFGTVGQPLYNVQIKCADDGEILAKGDNITQGYINKDQDTRDLFTEDGWLKTGDIGRFDERGYLIIEDRKKDLFKTSNGKQIAPQFLERILNSSPLIEQSYVAGERRPYCVALLVLSKIEIQLWAKQSGFILPEGGSQVWTECDEIYQLVRTVIDTFNQKLPQYETIKRFYLCPASFEGDRLTTASLKLKRKKLLEVYHHEIDAMYTPQHRSDCLPLST